MWFFSVGDNVWETGNFFWAFQTNQNCSNWRRQFFFTPFIFTNYSDKINVLAVATLPLWKAWEVCSCNTCLCRNTGSSVHFFKDHHSLRIETARRKSNFHNTTTGEKNFRSSHLIFNFIFSRTSKISASCKLTQKYIKLNTTWPYVYSDSDFQRCIQRGFQQALSYFN